ADCTERVRTGEIHSCVLFDPDFRVKQNGTNHVTFVVDNSRVNLVYQVIDALGKEFNLQSSAITRALTDDLLERLLLVQREVVAQIALADSVDADHAAVLSRLHESEDALKRVDLDIGFADLREVRSRVQTLSALVIEMDQAAEDAIQDTIDVIDDVKERCTACSNATIAYLESEQEVLENATEQLDALAAGAPTAVAEVGKIVDDAAQAMLKAKNRFDEVARASTDIQDALAMSGERLTLASLKLSQLRGTLRNINDALQKPLGLHSGSVSAPITTTIEPLSEESQLTFTYPAILMLVIMFLGLMLSSSLIVKDKTSTAAFRNFTTATRDEYHVFLSFVTTFLVLFVQCLIVLVITWFFVDTSFFDNFGATLLILLLGITLFSFLGMIIGYLAGTQEASMLAALSVGTVLLFVSNLVLPIEQFAPIVQLIAGFNPYVLLSELLKQSVLFGLNPLEAMDQLGVVAGAIVLLFVLILVVQRSFKSRFFQRQAKDLTADEFTATKRRVKPLSLLGRDVHDLFDLLEALDAMTRAQFESVVTTAKNPIASWVRTELQMRSLARKLRTRSKERMILALDKYLKRQTKKLAKQKR
ncbi:hypothetical protein D6789_02745, partial [Candidatus Woesearchaeota archaeon]